MDPFVGEIRLFGFDLAPELWAKCDGQTMQIVQNQALYSLLGVQFGGNGTSTFCLPDLRGRVPIHMNYGSPDTPPYNIGASGGAESVALTQNNIPVHTHTLSASAEPGNSNFINGTNNFFASSTIPIYSSSTSQQVQLSPQTCTSIGGSSKHDNMQPYLVINFCISLQGNYPPRQ